MTEQEIKFQNQLLALGLKPIEGKTSNDIFDKAKELTEASGEMNFNDPRLAALWEMLALHKVDLEWPELKFEPEAAMQKRCLQLADELVTKMDGKYPAAIGELDKDENWQHLLQHGKLGLMALLFALEKNDETITVLRAAVMIDEFMSQVEFLFLNILSEDKSDTIAKVLGVEQQKAGQSFEEFIFARMQPFSLMRSVYLEKPQCELRPLKWWTMHERYIPNLP